VQFGSPTVSHAGRGPRGYRRSDERIREDVCDLLTEVHDLDPRDIEVAVADAVVILSGSVDDRAARHRAEDLALLVPGVSDVHNRLTARRDERGAVRLL
jgi:osmotically-inducible protein OsmY